MKVTFIQAPEGLKANSEQWCDLAKLIKSESPDVLVTNEMPFGQWLACDQSFNQDKANVSIAAHQLGLEALTSLNIDTILSSQPKPGENKLINEAFVLDQRGYQQAHHKHYFPQEPSFYEVSWFETLNPGFEVIESNGLMVGFLLCTELMFNEWAREYRRQGAHIIVVPRASGQNVMAWKTAAAMAAVVSGCYVVSSNRVGEGPDGFVFGGQGFAYSPEGVLIAYTSEQHRIASFELDVNLVIHQQKQYPCYVEELNNHWMK